MKSCNAHTHTINYVVTACVYKTRHNKQQCIRNICLNVLYVAHIAHTRSNQANRVVVRARGVFPIVLMRKNSRPPRKSVRECLCSTRTHPAPLSTTRLPNDLAAFCHLPSSPPIKRHTVLGMRLRRALARPVGQNNIARRRARTTTTTTPKARTKICVRTYIFRVNVSNTRTDRHTHTYQSLKDCFAHIPAVTAVDTATHIDNSGVQRRSLVALSSVALS